MHLLEPALRGALRPSPNDLPRQRNLLLLGGGGTLGSALLAEALVVGRFARVQALVAGPLASALRGLEPLQQAVLQGAPVPPTAARTAAHVVADATAVIVFERQRHSNGRDDAFAKPEPADLLPLAQALHRHGVRRLLVVVPHAPALLPHALRHGLATLDEAAVDRLGFDQVLFIRAAQSAAGPGAGDGSGATRNPGTAGVAGCRRSWLERAAHWWLSQLRWMVPQQQMPLRATVLARLVVQLAQALPAVTRGTRVLAPELLQPGADGDVASAATAWLHGTAGPTPPP